MGGPNQQSNLPGFSGGLGSGDIAAAAAEEWAQVNLKQQAESKQWPVCLVASIIPLGPNMPYGFTSQSWPLAGYPMTGPDPMVVKKPGPAPEPEVMLTQTGRAIEIEE